METVDSAAMKGRHKYLSSYVKEFTTCMRVDVREINKELMQLKGRIKRVDDGQAESLDGFKDYVDANITSR